MIADQELSIQEGHGGAAVTAAARLDEHDRTTLGNQ
jgi:hypothetical protein